MHYLNQALFEAIKANNLDDVILFCELIKKREPECSFICETTDEQMNLLQCALKMQNPEIVNCIWEHVLDTPEIVFHTDAHGQSILHYAVQSKAMRFIADCLHTLRNHPELAEFINLFDKDGFTALHYAINPRLYDLALILILIYHGAEFCLAHQQEQDLKAMLKTSAEENNLNYREKTFNTRFDQVYHKTFSRTLAIKSFIEQIDDYLNSFHQKSVTTPISNTFLYSGWIIGLLALKQLIKGNVYNSLTLGVLDAIILGSVVELRKYELYKGRKSSPNEYIALLTGIKDYLELPLENNVYPTAGYINAQRKILDAVQCLSNPQNERTVVKQMHEIKKQLNVLYLAANKAVALSIFHRDVSPVPHMEYGANRANPTT